MFDLLCIRGCVDLMYVCIQWNLFIPCTFGEMVSSFQGVSVHVTFIVNTVDVLNDLILCDKFHGSFS